MEELRVINEKFTRTNQDTATNQRPIVKVGDIVKKNQAIVDGCSTDGGARSDVTLVAFMPWKIQF